MRVSHFQETYNKWRWDDDKGAEVQIMKVIKKLDLGESQEMNYKLCDITDPNVSESTRLVRCYKWKYNNNFIKMDLNGTKGWKVRRKPRWTASQKEWKKLYRFDWVKRWRNIVRNRNISDKIKEWWLECLNIHLRAAYHKLKCNVCNEEIGSFHFIGLCKGIDELKRVQNVYGFVYDELNWILWIWHCKGEPEYYTAIDKSFGKVTSKSTDNEG